MEFSEVDAIDESHRLEEHHNVTHAECSEPDLHLGLQVENGVEDDLKGADER